MMGYEYKTIPAPSELRAKSAKDIENVIRGYGELITREAHGGWEYHSMSSMVTSLPEGCSLFGKRVNVYHYMLVFQRKLPD